MNLNFHDIFQHTSTAALLVIRQQPEQYQPEAVAAAEELLKERNITPEDQVEADALMKEKEILKSISDGIDKSDQRGLN